MSTPAFRPDTETFDKLYREQPSDVPWDVHQAQPRLMELEALGGFSGEVLDIGCGVGDNAIYLASRGHSVTGLDGSAAAIEEARRRAAAAGVSVNFDVADATDLRGYEGRFDTVVDSALYHCLDEEGQQAYIAALYRATRPGARLHLSCFSDGNVNGVIAPIGHVSEANLRDTLTANGWRIDFVGPTTYLGNAVGFQAAKEMPPEAQEQMRRVTERFARIADFIEDNRVHLPFTVVHAHRAD